MRKQRILFFSFLLFMWAGLETSAQQTSNLKAAFEIVQNKVGIRTQMVSEYQANGNQFKDVKAFFLNEMEIVKAAESYLRLANDKKDQQNNVMSVLSTAESAVPYLHVGATQFVYSEPAVAVKLLDEYFRAVASPQFSKLNLTAPKDAYYVYATALEAIGGDKAKIESSLKEALTSQYGALACQQLQTLYKERGDQDSYKRYLEYGFKNFPENLIPSINWLQELLISKDYAAVIRDADIVIGRINNGTAEASDEAWYPFYFKAVSFFNSNQYENAYKAFVEADAKCPRHIELVMGAATSAMKCATQKYSDEAAARQWYQTALPFLKKAESEFPDESSQWGYLLYSCYTFLGDATMAAKYKKYLNY